MGNNQAKQNQNNVVLPPPQHRVVEAQGDVVSVMQVESWAKDLKALDNKFRGYTLVTTDKPIYKPGDTVYFRACVLDVFNHAPHKTLSNICTLNVEDGQNSSVHSATVGNSENVYYGQWKIPESQAGGDFNLKFAHTDAHLIPGERKINIRSFRNPKIKSNIEFSKKGYSAGEEVTVFATIEKAEGGKFSNATTLVYIVRVDEEECFRSTPQRFLSAELGTSEMKFTLPEYIQKGDGSLTILIQESGSTETASKTIPIVLQTVDISLYPESSDNIIAGAPLTVYFEARSPISKEVMEVQGQLVDTKSNTVIATLQTQHEGRGKFTFTPSLEANYSIRITQPSGVQNVRFANPANIEEYLSSLPAVTTTGYNISVPSTVSKQATNIPVTIYRGSSSSSTQVILEISKKEQTIASHNITFETGANSATVDVKIASHDGVVTATLLESTVPVAERLLFVKSDNSIIKIDVSSKHKKYIPQQDVEVTITATNNKGEAVDAILGVAVTDDSVLQMVEKRKQSPRIETMYFLETEVENLQDAQIYLNSASSQKADEALDLLLGTQGWRRFVYSKSESEVFSSDRKDKFGRVVAATASLLEESRNQFLIPEVNFAFGGGERLEMCFEECAVECDYDDMDTVQCCAVTTSCNFAASPVSMPVLDDILVEPVREFGMVSKQTAAKAAEVESEPVQTRSNFVDTIHWDPYVKTKAGKAVLKFKLNDSITSFRTVVDAFGVAGGALGSSEDFVIHSSKAFYIDAKLPTRCTIGDRLEVPVTVTNNSLKKLVGFLDHAVVKGGEQIKGQIALSVDPESKFVAYVPVSVDKTFLGQNVSISVAAKADVPGGKTFPFKDSVSRKLEVDPNGTPEKIFFSDRIASRKFTEFPFTIPSGLIADVPLEFTFQVFPSSSSNVLKAVEALIREPYGCFEQTSSVVYPMIMARRYFKQHLSEVDPKIVETADRHLRDGYKKLVGYECKSGGYEWFGSEPAHEALTAYGVLEFTDMCDIYPVDRDMLERTTKWLLSRSAATGSFERNSLALDDFGGAPTHTTNGYIVWSLTNAGIPESAVEKNIEWLLKELPNYSDDAYFIGLVAGTLMNIGKSAEAKKLADKLVSIQTASGSVENAKTSITRSQGKSLAVETTSISILTWLKYGTQNNPYVANIEKAIQWLSSQCSNGYFGSTQGTVLALKALLSYETESLKQCKIFVNVDGNKIAEVELGDQKPGEAIESKPKLHLTPGDHKLSITALSESSGSALCAATISYRVNKSDSSEASKHSQIQFSASLAHATLKQGEPTEIKVQVSNLNEKEDKGMTVAIVGVPSGLDVRVEKLQELVKAKQIAAYELKEKNVVLYWRGLAPGAKISLLVDAVAAVPGTYTGASSCGYLYYFEEHKIWQQGMSCAITK